MIPRPFPHRDPVVPVEPYLAAAAAAPRARNAGA